jgi:hypothetical protein
MCLITRQFIKLCSKESMHMFVALKLEGGGEVHQREQL